jgi:hypothetical protein
MCKPRSEFIFCGDINVNFLMDSNQKMKASSLLQSYNMFNVTDILTRICDESVSADDSIFLDGSRINLLAVVPIFNSLSDHEVQCLVLDKILVNDKCTLPHRTPLINTSILKNFIDVLKNETWENIHPMNHINDILKVFLKSFLIYS